MHKNVYILLLSLPAVMLVGGVSCVGLFSSGFYHLETINWQAQSIGQDIIDLFVVSPVLLICAAKACAGNRLARAAWGGTNLYLIYTFAIYSFDLHFNILFYFYCLILGIAFYSFAYFIYLEVKEGIPAGKDFSPRQNFAGYYLIATSIVFYTLWLSDVFTAMVYHTVPKTLADAGLPTNPVQVLDLAVFLPAVFGIGVLLLRHHKIGQWLAPVILFFLLLMNITIAGLMVVMYLLNQSANWYVAIIMFLLAGLNFFLLISWKKNQSGTSVYIHEPSF